MRCPTCKKIYDEPALRYCLDDGAVLQPTHARFEQDVPTLTMKNQPAQGVASAFPTRIIDPKIVDTLYQTLITFDKQPLTLDEIYQLAPRFMNDDDILTSVGVLLKRKALIMFADPHVRKPQYYWKEQDEIVKVMRQLDLSEEERQRLDKIEQQVNERLITVLEDQRLPPGASLSLDDCPIGSFTPMMQVSFIAQFKAYGWRIVTTAEHEHNYSVQLSL